MMKSVKDFLQPLKNGITYFDAKGYYSNSDRKIIYFVINRFQVSKMRNIVHEIDPNAYISISEIADVFKINHDNKK